MTRADLRLAGGAIVLGVLLFAGTWAIDPGAGYDRIGPRVFPIAIAAGFVLLGTALAIVAWRLPRSDSPARASAPLPPLDWRSLGYLAAGCLLCVVFLEPLGFVGAAALQFWLVARAFRSTKPVRDAGVAVALAVVVFFTFSRGLGLALPEGLLAGLL